MRFLFDECLHVSLVAAAHGAGHEAYHVVHRGWSGYADHRLLRRVLAHDLVLVTNDAKDFTTLFGRQETHPGLIVILPSCAPPRQRELFAAALVEIARLPSLVDLVVEVDQHGRCRTYELRRPPHR